MSLPDALAYAQGLLDECPAKGNINKHNNVLAAWMQLCTEKEKKRIIHFKLTLPMRCYLETNLSFP